MGTVLGSQVKTGEPGPVRRDRRRPLRGRARRQPVDGSGAVGGLPVHVGNACTGRLEDDLPAVGRPDRHPVCAWIEGQAPERLLREIPDPDVSILIVDCSRQARAVGRQARRGIGAQRRASRFFLSLSINPEQRARRRHLTHSGTDVHESACTRDRVIGRAGRLHHQVVDDRHRIAEHLEPGGIEPHGAQRASRCEDQVAGLHVLGVAAAPNQRLALAGLQVEDSDRASAWPAVAIVNRTPRPRGSTDGSAWVALMLCRVRRRQDRWLTAVCRYPPQAGARTVGGERDRVVVAPACAKRHPAELAQRDGGPPAIDTFFKSVFSKNPIHRLSGEKNGAYARETSATGWASSRSIARTISGLPAVMDPPKR